MLLSYHTVPILFILCFLGIFQIFFIGFVINFGVPFFLRLISIYFRIKVTMKITFYDMFEKLNLKKEKQTFSNSEMKKNWKLNWQVHAESCFFFTLLCILCVNCYKYMQFFFSQMRLNVIFKLFIYFHLKWTIFNFFFYSAFAPDICYKQSEYSISNYQNYHISHFYWSLCMNQWHSFFYWFDSIRCLWSYVFLMVILIEV